MDSKRRWTSFVLDAEVDMFGTERIAAAHNELQSKAARLEAQVKELETENRRLREAAGLQWISVDDRLPADDEWCWVDGDAFNGPFPALRSVGAAGGWSNEDCWEDFENEVERWCPIPKPPASGEDK